MTRVGVGLLLALATIAAGVLLWSHRTPAPVDAAGSQIRNVILISIDTLRADHLGTYGYARPTSPSLDALAERGVLFERALSHAPNTPPSHASMLMSLYPGRHGFTGNGDKLPTQDPTLAEVVQRAGLRTAGFVDGGYLSHGFGFGRGFDLYDDRGGGFAAILPKAEQWIEQHRADRFFVFLHGYDVHTPYEPPAPFRDLFHETPYHGTFEPDTQTMLRAAFQGLKLSPEEVAHAMASYDEEIRATDAKLGAFFEQLRERGVLDDTAVIVTSDHGEEFGEHGSFTHWQLFYQPDLHVPLLLAVPGLRKPGTRVAVPVQLVDVLPTVLGLLALPPLATAQGVSLVPLLDGDVQGARERGFPIERAAPAWPPEPAKMAVRSLTAGRYHLRFQAGLPAPLELFDIDADPMLQRNLASQQPAVAESLRREAEEILAANQPLRKEAAPIDEATQQRLRELGYLK